MKSIVVLIITIVLCTAHIKAQKTKAVLILKSGSQLEGFAKMNHWGKIKFRKDKKGKSEHFTFDQVDTLKLFEDEEPTIYVQVKIKDKDKPKILELADHGKNVICYRDVVHGNTHQTFMPNGSVMTTGFWGTITYSYLRKTGEEEATYLASTNWLSGNFKKTASNYFADCPSLVAKIQGRELKRGHLTEIIDYYNTKCE